MKMTKFIVNGREDRASTHDKTQDKYKYFYIYIQTNIYFYIYLYTLFNSYIFEKKMMGISDLKYREQLGFASSSKRKRY